MRFGVAKEIITPEKPIRLACSGVFDKNYVGVHDDVYVRTLILDDKNEKIVLISYDLLFHSRDLNEALEKYAHKKYGIKHSNVVVSCTHSHMSPAVKGYNDKVHDPDYEEFIIARGKRSIDIAINSMFEGTLHYGSFEGDFNVSRRKVTNGKNLGLPDFNVRRDKEFFIFCIKDNDKNIRSIVSNYACHPVFYPAKDQVSSEFPGRLCAVLDAKYENCTSLFFQSACGDVRPKPTAKIDPETGEYVWDRNFNFDFINTFATSMAEFVVDKLQKLTEVENPEFISDSFKIKLPIEPASLEFFIEDAKEQNYIIESPNYNNSQFIINGGYDTLAEHLYLHCSIIKLSEDLYIATTGGEPIYGVKAIVKETLGKNNLCFIGYTDACAYIVDDLAIEEGGYEPLSFVEYCLKGPFKPGVDKLYIKAFKDSLKRIEEKNADKMY